MQIQVHPKSELAYAAAARQLAVWLTLPGVRTVMLAAGNTPLDLYARIAARGADVLVLGLGQNGHLGFNEPGSTEHCTARVLELDPVSIHANRQWFQGDYAPSRGATVGMNTILAARRILLVAVGAHKLEAVTNMILDPRDPACPASLLQGHSGTVVVLDEAAAANLQVNPA